jgi:hypothetical protein
MLQSKMRRPDLMATPLRLSEKLVEKAKKVARTSMRSAPKQVEHWAHIGQKVEPFLTSTDLTALANGEVEIRVVRKKSAPIEVDRVFDELEKDRSEGTLHSKIVQSKIWYEASKKKPGFLDRVSASGKRETGKFIDGLFKVLS